MRNKFSLCISRIVLIILIAVSGYLTFAGMFSTVCLTDTEHVYFCADNPVIHIIAIATVLAIAIILRLNGKGIFFVSTVENKKFPIIVLATYLLTLSYIVISVNLVPTFDQLHVSEAAIGILNGDYSSFLPGGYARLWDNQSGFILYLVGVYAIFGEGNVIAVQLLNVLYSMITLGMIYAFANRLAPKIAKVILVLAACFMPMWFFATFVYGTAPSLMLSVIAMVLEYDYFESSKKADSKWSLNLSKIILSAATIALATVLKTNALIYMLAMIVYAIVEEIDFFAANSSGNKNDADRYLSGCKYKHLIAIVLILIFYILAGKAIGATMKSLTGMDNLSGTPRTAHIAMGLQESSNKSSGWFNGYNQAVFAENGYDHDAANVAAVADIMESVGRFKSSPSNAVGFFLKKIVSQWCEPTCESLFILMSRGSLSNSAKWLDFAVVGGVGNGSLIAVMNIGQNLLYFGTFIYAVWAFTNARKTRFSQIYFVIENQIMI